MFYKVKVAISNRHVHLTKGTYEKLFDEPITKKNDLHQIGQFAANNDARKLRVSPPVRTSGDLVGSLPITLKTNKCSVELEEGLIIADRHVHFNTSDANKYHVKDKDKVKIHILGEKRGTIEAFAKVSDDGYFELHLDTDDANAFLLENDDELVLEIN